MLLTAAALFIRGANKAASVDTGLKPGPSFILEVDASLAGYESKRAQNLYRNLNEHLAVLPGVERASISATVPFGMISLKKNVQRAGLQPAADAKPATAADGLAFNATWNSVGADYFSTVGLRVLRGRTFTEAETTQPGGSPVAIIDDVLANKLWPDGDALGQHIQFAGDGAPHAKSNGGSRTSNDLNGEIKPDETMEIVGIVPATRHTLFQRIPNGAIYLPFAHGFQSDVSFFIRFRSIAPGTEGATADLLRRAVRDVDPAIPIVSLKTFGQHLDGSVQLWIVRGGGVILHLWRARTLPRGRRTLRSESVFSGAPDARNWHSHGVRCATRHGLAHDHARKLDHALVRRGARIVAGHGGRKNS